jgi:hypothetical protein
VLVLASFFLFLGTSSYSTAFGDSIETEKSRNAQRIEAINMEAAPLSAELRRVQQLIDEHNSRPPNARDHNAVAAYNSLSDRLNQQKNSLISRLKGLKEEQDRLIARNREIDTTVRSTVRSEQNAFDQMNEAWLRKQEALIRESISRDRARRDAILRAIRSIQVPEPAHRPRSLDDTLPGDVLLYAPARDWSALIPPADYLYRVASDLSRGDVFLAIERRPAPASHALTFVRRVNGVMLFLDHTSEGSRILDRHELNRKYGDRSVYLARPQTAPDGRVLWLAAREAALRNKPYYGVLPGQLVCSEQVCVAISKATNSRLSNNRLGPIDITPGDFFDSEAIGKHFVVFPLESGR